METDAAPGVQLVLVTVLAHWRFQPEITMLRPDFNFPSDEACHLSKGLDAARSSRPSAGLGFEFVESRTPAIAQHFGLRVAPRSDVD